MIELLLLPESNMIDFNLYILTYICIYEFIYDIVYYIIYLYIIKGMNLNN